jgi:hypothetical protein
MPREAYQPPAPAPPAESYQPSAAAGINRYPGLAMEQRKMHLAGDYYRSQVNLQQQQQQQQQLEKPADMLAHDHYLGESKLLYLPVVTGLPTASYITVHKTVGTRYLFSQDSRYLFFTMFLRKLREKKGSYPVLNNSF